MDRKLQIAIRHSPYVVDYLVEKEEQEMRNLKIWAIALVVFTLVVGCRSAASSRPAVMYRGDAQRSGAFDTKGIRQLSGTLWQFKTGGPVWSSPVVADGVVYFGSDDNFFYAVDARTGQEQWRFETGDDVRSSPAIADGIVYFRSYDHYLYAADARSGQLVWKANLMDVSLDEGETLPREQYDDFMSSPLVANGTVYAGGYLASSRWTPAPARRNGDSRDRMPCALLPRFSAIRSTSAGSMTSTR
jgi:hypothetical protein